MSKTALIFLLIVFISCVTAMPQNNPGNPWSRIGHGRRANAMLSGLLSNFPRFPKYPSLRRSGSEMVMASSSQQVENNGVVKRRGQVLTMDKDGNVQHLRF